MAYFKNIHSLAELKKEYRRLALENHPDKGGSTEVMQQINVEFERLHEIWKNDTTISANASGYENDYAGASAKEYTDFVYNEYRWKGRNYQGQHTPEIVELVRNWMKETYPKISSPYQDTTITLSISTSSKQISGHSRRIKVLCSTTM